MLKIRRSHDRLIFNMGIPIPGKDGLYIEIGPWFSHGKSRYAFYLPISMRGRSLFIIGHGLIYVKLIQPDIEKGDLAYTVT